MGCRAKELMPGFFLVTCLLITLSSSKSIVKNLPGFHGDLPFKLETGYVGIGDGDEVQLFYYFVESQSNPEKDPLLFFIPGGPGASALGSISYGRIGPIEFNVDNGLENLTIKSNPYSWTKMASVIYVDIPAGTGFSYAKTKEAWVSSDSTVAAQTTEFIRRFLMDHPDFQKNPLYITGLSYMGIIVPVVTLQLFEGNERGNRPSVNIQGYIIYSPLTDKFMDFNSRFEYAHRMALISDDIYKLSIENCHGDYVNIDSTTNSLCAHGLQRYDECTRLLNFENILEPTCDELDQLPQCLCRRVLEFWANNEAVQQALNIHHGTIGTWKLFNNTIHYAQGKNDTFCYAYDIFSSFDYHKKLAGKKCRALIFSGDADLTFPYTGAVQWITSLNMTVESQWMPYYIHGQVGGYEMAHVQKNFSLTYATVKGAGHQVPMYKPKESLDVLHRWLGLPSPYLSTS